MKILVVANQKGGVGKTTTTLNLAASLAAAGRKILLLDIDSQANLTTGLGGKKTYEETTITDVLLDDASLESLIQRKPDFNFDVIPGSPDLISAELEMARVPDPTSILKGKLNLLANKYDYCLIDSPPSLGMLSVSALRAADKIIIPLQCEHFSIEGLAAMQRTIIEINEATGSNLKIDGILRTMFDQEKERAREISEKLEKSLPHQVFSTIIPRCDLLAEAPSEGKPIMYIDPDAKGTLAYFARLKKRKEGFQLFCRLSKKRKKIEAWAPSWALKNPC